MNTTPQTVSSADGTRIAFEQAGAGAPVILIGGAFNDRTTVAALASVLASDFTTIVYDRRGRGGSGDSGEYAVQREVDDLAALIEHVGGSAYVFGHSSGAALAIEAAQRGLPITKLALYEPSYVVEGTRARPGADLADRLRDLIAQDRRDDAITLFLTEAADVPAEMVDGMKSDPMWSWFVGLAHTLSYDAAVCGPGNAVQIERLAEIAVPTLVVDGSESPAWLLAAAGAVAEAVPGARHLTLDGQDHGVLNQPEALRPALVDFLS